MAIDNTPPKLKLIATVGIIVVVTLVGLNFVFQSYMAYMNDMAMREKLAPPKDREAQAAAEQAAFAKAKMPVEQAMKQVAAGTRDPSIQPQPSDDTGALTGWSKLPKPLPQAQMVGVGATNTAPAPVSADGGAAPLGAADGGAAMPMAAGDAGAPKAATDAGAHIAPAPGMTPQEHHTH